VYPPEIQTPKLVNKKKTKELSTEYRSTFKTLLFTKRPIKKTANRDPYTHGAVICEPINKSDINITKIGNKILHLFLTYKPDINAIVKIGVKLGACGISLKRTPIKIKKPQNK